MSTKKKTGDKLVASMRKSKAGTVASKSSKRPDVTKKTVKSKKTAAELVSQAVIEQGHNNLFSHGSRVWPD